MLSVILADDEQYERNYLEKVIKESYPGPLEIVYKAVDGLDLMEKLEECKPQIVLLDIMMPRINGLNTAEEVRKRHPDIEIVLISAYSDFSLSLMHIFCRRRYDSSPGRTDRGISTDSRRCRGGRISHWNGGKQHWNR